MEIGFDQALIALGSMLVVLAVLSGWLDSAVLSTTVLAVGAGFAFAATGVVTTTAGSDALVVIVELTLIVTLFNDGMTVEGELLRRHWRPPLRALVVAMPITLVLIAVAGKALFSELDWTEAFLLGAILMPTDPVITSSIVASPRVPRRIRHALTVESGLNDGLALPVVLVLLAISQGGAIATEATQSITEVIVGGVVGALLAVVVGRVIERLPETAIAARYTGLVAAGLPLLAYGVTDATFGNGLIAAFLAGIALAVTGPDIPARAREVNETGATALQLIALFAFGALVNGLDWNQQALPLLAFVLVLVLVARPAAILIAFSGVRMPLPQKLFIAWFGPKGVATILFSLLVLNSFVDHRELIFSVATYCVLGSVLVHGLTESVGARLIGRDAERRVTPAKASPDD